MAGNKDPLQDLLVDADDVDRSRLAAGLKSILGVDTKTGRIVFKPVFAGLTARQKLLAFLLGRKVAWLLGKIGAEEARTTDIRIETGLPIGTVGPVLKQLKSEKSISQTPSREYYVASHQLDSAISEVTKESE